MLYNVDPTLEDVSEEDGDGWNDVRGRAVYAGMLITDWMKGVLDMMTESTYPGQKGQHPEFGEEILKLAGEMCGSEGEGEDEDEGGDNGDDKGDEKEKKVKKNKNKNKNRKKNKKTAA